MDYMHFETISAKHSLLAFFCPFDGTITINLDNLKEECDSMVYCNTENVIIERLIDIIIHEELHKRFDEVDEDHYVLNEQDEDIFKLIRDWVERDKLS